MNNERKKTVISGVKPIVPKKRVVEELVTKPSETLISIKEENEEIKKEEKKRKIDFKTIRVAINADIEEKKHVADRVQKGELSLAYFAVDGDNSYHYYFINK